MASRKPHERKNSTAVLARIREIWELAVAWWKSMSEDERETLKVCVSDGNAKIGNCFNVSIMPVVTCGAMGKLCGVICYAVRSFVQMGFKGDKWKGNPWLINTLLAIHDANRYFAEIKSAIEKGLQKKRNPIRYFRWHVGGEILSVEYFERMCKLAEGIADVRFLSFTKRYEIVNQYMDEHGGRAAIPQNLSVIFSAAPGQSVPNPYHLPECHINMESEKLNGVWRSQYAESQIYHCPGNCETCQCNGAGCWFLKDNTIVLINQH